MNWHRKHKDDLTFGQRAACVLRDFVGSWMFVYLFTLLSAFWMIVNTVLVARHSFDPFPFILLNLGYSFFAGLQSSFILMASRLQDQSSAALAQHDYEVNLRSKEEIEDLIRRLDRIETQRLDELRALALSTLHAILPEKKSFKVRVKPRRVR